MANSGIDELRSRLSEFRRLLAASMTDEQRLFQRYTEASRDADRWRRRAELAASKGSGDLARAALERSAHFEARASEYHLQYLRQKTHVERMKSRLLEMEARSFGAWTRSRAAADVGRLELTIARLDRQMERAAEERARLAALAELERDEVAEKLAALEREDRIERELAELKARMGSRFQVSGSGKDPPETGNPKPETG